jgi:hypothetical protein
MKDGIACMQVGKQLVETFIGRDDGMSSRTVEYMPTELDRS